MNLGKCKNENWNIKIVLKSFIEKGKNIVEIEYKLDIFEI